MPRIPNIHLKPWLDVRMMLGEQSELRRNLEVAADFLSGRAAMALRRIGR